MVDESLYQNLNRLHPQRVGIERALAARERTLFNLDARLFLYDLTSTYFEGQALENPQAQRGYSRDSRPDCKQVVVGLVLDRDGFPQAHEVFEGNRPDRTTVADMLGSSSSGWAASRARPWWWTGAWRSPTTCTRSPRAATTISWPAGAGEECLVRRFRGRRGLGGDDPAPSPRTPASRRPGCW